MKRTPSALPDAYSAGEASEATAATILLRSGSVEPDRNRTGWRVSKTATEREQAKRRGLPAVASESGANHLITDTEHTTRHRAMVKARSIAVRDGVSVFSFSIMVGLRAIA